MIIENIGFIINNHGGCAKEVRRRLAWAIQRLTSGKSHQRTDQSYDLSFRNMLMSLNSKIGAFEIKCYRIVLKIR